MKVFDTRAADQSAFEVHHYLLTATKIIDIRNSGAEETHTFLLGGLGAIQKLRVQDFDIFYPNALSM